jgi:hypothetical protein
MSISQRIRHVSVLCALCLLMACGGKDPAEDPVLPPTPQPPPPLPAIEPRMSVIEAQILERTCVGSQCHSAGQSDDALELTGGRAYAELVNKPAFNAAARAEGRILVVPGKPDESFLVMKLKGPLDPRYGALMPRGTQGVKQNEYDAIVEWIRRGALND